MSLKCPDCHNPNEDLIIVRFEYDKETGKFTPYVKERWLCQNCGHQQPIYICRECGKDQDEVKLKTQLDIKNTYLCTDCMR
jgi:hypothetical protein